MKISEYKKEIDNLLKKSKRLDERLEMREISTKWLVQKADDISRRLDEAHELDNLSWDEKEQLYREAEEILARLNIEKNLVVEDGHLNHGIGDDLDKLDQKKLSEGIQPD